MRRRQTGVWVGVLMGLVLSLLAGVPAQAVTLIPEQSFEGARPEADGWNYTASWCTSSPCAYLDYSTDWASSGSKSLKGTYSAAWSDPNPQINTAAIYKGFAPVTEVYLKYIYRTSRFTYNVPSTKHIYYKGSAGYPNGGSAHWYGSREIGFFLQNTADCGYVSCNLYPNMASKPLADYTNYCIEEHFKLNTVGAADGMVEMWVDGVQTLGYYNRTFRGTVANGTNGNSSNMQFDDLEIFKQNGDGDMYYDQFMAATTRIGCGAGSGGGGGQLPDPSLPNAPSKLFVTELWEDLKALAATLLAWLEPVTASAETAASDAVTITWPDPKDATLQYRFRLSHFASTGWIDLGLKPSALGSFVYALPGLPQTAGDRYVCIDGQGVRNGVAGKWFSEVTGSPACNQMAMGPIAITPPPVPTPAPAPVPTPAPVQVPAPVPPATVTMSGDSITIQCDKTRYTRMKTTGTGTKRTVTCLK